MDKKSIAVIATGDMGHGVGRVLREHGYRVMTCLAGRSERSCKLALEAGIEDLPDLKTVALEADIFLSILPPDSAVELASRMAARITEVSRSITYVDCNAVAPETAAEISRIVTTAGASFIDAGIIGLAPGKALPRFYVSGDDTSAMEALDGCGFTVIPMLGGGCQASAIKMCYAALTKGTWSLHTAVLLAAHQLGVSNTLIDELSASQAEDLERMRARVPLISADSGRWVGEMEQIALTFGEVGVPNSFHKGAAEIFKILAKTPLANETRESMDTSRTIADVVPIFAKHLHTSAK